MSDAAAGRDMRRSEVAPSASAGISLAVSSASAVGFLEVLIKARG